MPPAVQLLLDRHGAKAPRDDGSELPAGFGIRAASQGSEVRWVRHLVQTPNCIMGNLYAPHPSLLPMGEGVRLCPLQQRPFSHGEKDRMRGEKSKHLRRA